mgnify:FL=1
MRKRLAVRIRPVCLYLHISQHSELLRSLARQPAPPIANMAGRRLWSPPAIWIREEKRRGEAFVTQHRLRTPLGVKLRCFGMLNFTRIMPIAKGSGLPAHEALYALPADSARVRGCGDGCKTHPFPARMGARCSPPRLQTSPTFANLLFYHASSPPYNAPSTPFMEQ